MKTLRRKRIGTLASLFAFALLMVGLTLAPSASAGVNQWTVKDGVFPGGFSLTYSPSFASDHTVFSRANGSVYKSTDGGNTWNQITFMGSDASSCTFWDPSASNNNCHGVDSLALSPNYANDHTVFVGRGTYIIKSTDGGATWEPYADWANTYKLNGCYSCGYAGTPIAALAVSPNYANDHTVLAGNASGWPGWCGLFRSTDGGATFTGPYIWEPSATITTINFSPNYANDQTVLLGVIGGNSPGIWRSTNPSSWTLYFQIGSNDSWSLASTNPAHTIAISPDFASDHTVFEGNAGDGPNGVWVSTDGGANWGPEPGANWQSVDSLAISPTFAADRTIFAGVQGAGQVYQSNDGGNTWSANPGNLDAGGQNDWAGEVSVWVTPEYSLDHTVLASAGNGNIWSYTFDSNPVCAIPSLSLAENRVYWASLADYDAHNLSIDFTVKNSGNDLAYDSQVTGSTATNGVTLGTSAPIYFGTIAAGSSYQFTLQYSIPAGVTSFRTTVSASAQDACGNTYTYPPPATPPLS